MLERLSGGRTNRVWRIDWPGGDAVLKQYRAHAETPLFRNDPDAEWLALKRLSQTGLAPEPLARRSGELIYRHVMGTAAVANARETATVLWSVHSREAPAALPEAPVSSAALLEQTRAMLEDCQDKSLSAYAPADPRCSLCLDAFLHGDPVPGNVISTKAGAVLIDWQCPARGDPVLDLFLAASPGMRAIYGGSIELEALLSAYGAPSVTERFRTLAPLLHWRMAVYGQWKMEHGDPAYAVVRDAEKRALGI